MATFTWSPSYSAQKAHRPRVLLAQFGDGYEQRVADGINTNPEMWDVQFATRRDDEADQIDNFLKSRGGVEAFDWVTPFGLSGKFVCRDWQRTKTGPLLSTISAKFEQVFEA